MLEPQMQNDSIFTTQGAGVSKDGKAFLLLGKRGAGKTSTTLELCRKYNYKLIGNDLVVVGYKNNEGYFFWGSKIFTLRYTAVKYHNTDLQTFFKKAQSEWMNKVKLLPQDIKISVEKKHPKIIKVLYVHLLNNKSSPLYIQKIGSREASYMGKLYLYEELTRYIRGVCIPIVYGSDYNLGGYLPSLDKAEYYENRVKFIDWKDF